jgi:hypothetical protein
MTKSRARTKTHAAKSLATHDEAVADRRSHGVEEPPPFGGSWAKLYAAVLVNLAVLVVLFYLFTRAFR